MQLSEFSFDLPNELIAQSPIEPRDQARLLVYDRERYSIIHARVADIGSFLPAGSRLVANNSRVRQGRLFATAVGKPIEVLVLEEAGAEAEYLCLIGGKGLQPGQEITFFANARRDEPVPLSAIALDLQQHPAMTTYRLRFTPQGMTVEEAFARFGHTPLPPYIQNESANPERYQTVFASQLGSAAAPTAGLHFTTELRSRLSDQGIGWSEVTLHVGLGTFLPLRQERVEENRLHTEHTHIAPETAARLQEDLDAKRPLVAVGTTSTRTLESHMNNGVLNPGWLDTSMFIYPGYRFQAVSALLTNFHLPKSSLLLLVSAFLANRQDLGSTLRPTEEAVARLQYIYGTAIKEGYRFYSFGDAMLII